MRVRGWPLAALIVVLVIALTTVPGTASSADTAAAPTSLVLTAPASGKVTGPATLTATLTSNDTPVAGAAVRFDQLSDGVWTTVGTGTGTTDTQGVVSYDATLTGTANTFRADYDGNDLFLAAESNQVRVPAKKYSTRLVLGGPEKLVDGHSTTVTVSWLAVSGKPVTGPVQIERRLTGSTWHRYKTVRTDADGRTSLRVAPRVDSRWRAHAADGSWYLGDDSGVHTIDNLPPDTPVSYPKHAARPSYLAPQERARGRGANVTVSRVPSSVWNTMTGITWHRGCPVGRDGLRYLRVNYRGFDGYRHRGSLVVNARAAQRFKSVFTDLYAAGIPIRRMFVVDRFGYSRRSGGGDDYKAMRYDNTSAFNCRWVTGRPGVRSPHSYGYALDLNTWENPYHSAQGWLPNGWWPHRGYGRIAWRSGRHSVVKILRSNGFSWTYGTEDSQHFDAPGGRRYLAGSTCRRFCD